MRVRPPASPEFLQLVDKLAPDTWIEFRLPGHPPARARLLTMFQKTGEFLFVNREGAKDAKDSFVIFDFQSLIWLSGL